ncbi:hypothetical protein PUMCH_004787 [Australozyma saopauloensis]|uniref:Zn(2)-C6 fungal-type domain-containing protein n=1 Tax=Australozyma saopauloensis TaxID=291208 RepID=A0AAX4HFM4_9ASCO|nr:hypothetical protein PUMCH_004787 [[Candida] saopauloensis]
MNSNHDQQLEPCDPFVKLVKDIPQISQYVDTIQLGPKSAEKFESTGKVEGLMFVFRKKKIPIASVSDLNLYRQSLRTFELERNNNSKSRFSCDRCRKYKKKCSRDLPECEYCVSSEEYCSYRPRKKITRRQTKASRDSQPGSDSTVKSPSEEMLEPISRQTSESSSHKSKSSESSSHKSTSTIYQLLN